MIARRPILVMLPGLFFGLVLAARAWFWTAPDPSAEYLRFEVRSSVPDWAFHAEPVGEVAQGVLATTNLFNGTFSGPNGLRITTFSADWRADSSAAMSVVHHTPDICWVGVGMKATSLGQPQSVTLKFGDRAAPFECRVFALPHDPSRELVLWCTLVGGSFRPEPTRWSIEDEAGDQGRELRFWSARRIAAGHFLENVSQHRRGIGEKQFVRFSTRVNESWENSLDLLRTFASEWLELRASRRNP